MDNKINKAEAFVAYALKKCDSDNGFAARLRRADNPDTEYQSYDSLVQFGVEIVNDQERMPYQVIGAALARLQSSVDGTANLGQTLKSCFEDSEQGDSRLRRLLACNTQEEVCRVLRPLLRLIQSKGLRPLSYSGLLNDLLYFNRDPKRVKLRWAEEYYGYKAETEIQEESA